ncbi:Amidohydrolase family protein [Desulfatibacillum alkenivorans DSM 16219]|jgi:imidazolonepropionase-like amidohydrolase|uniref:Amidohydrolase family protein n=1 Tax=Desulfatibacillum alkenivorans DSM 16219 TaxID=1121393 RepID=A0A1M6W079_9BACT|nr:amidohydrolase family protein [Desulfatibacillum alkenivorans]SHK87161.1 Amidohydrolase family protein [Desulfatibacillum alkenivorans DSM 16219]
MNRRQFLAVSSAVSSALLLGSCASTTNRYQLPEALVKPDDKLALTNLSIVDVQTGTIRRENCILIQQGRIAQLFTKEDWPSVQADREIDLQGGYVMPGLINAHCHMTAPCSIAVSPAALFSYKRQVERNAEECIKHGVTTVRDMLSVADWVSGVQWLQERMDRGKIAGPRIMRSVAIDINNGYGDMLTNFSTWESWHNVGSIKEARKAVRSSAAGGADAIKLFQQETKLLLPCNDMPLMDKEMVAAVCDEAAKCGLPVAMHHMEIGGLGKGLYGGVNTLEHMVCDAPVPEEALEKLISQGTYVVPTISIPYGYVFPVRGDENWGTESTDFYNNLRSDTLQGFLGEFCEPVFVEGGMDFCRKFSDPDSYEKHHLIPWLCPSIFNAYANQGVANIKALYEAGVKMGCGNDGGVPFVFPGNIGFEMVLLEEAGLQTTDILKMATINNAHIIGMENDLGTVESPKIADLAVFPDNPLETASNALKPSMVLQAGRVVFQA